ncbi:hypothetical protein HCH_07002 [Hahella chejuensis KCTC 2396]|uniref:Uncharacterized protein n=1 Tax=Hahella chejuensis (strain KCTC 2396) TaxID=349521 RepID=Q2S6V7_HAHCH|nr:hypothetical protein HCH_07002 [Hahella chejuensis KCTC 2396]
MTVSDVNWVDLKWKTQKFSGDESKFPVGTDACAQP